MIQKPFMLIILKRRAGLRKQPEYRMGQIFSDWNISGARFMFSGSGYAKEKLYILWTI